MGVSEGTFSFSNQAVQSNSGNFNSDRQWRRLRFEAGKSYRIKFIDSDKIEMRRRHYNPREGEQKGYYRCLAHAGYCPACAAAERGFGGEGKYKIKKAAETFGANVLVYTTDAMGNPTQPLNAEVYFWAFNAKKFVAIRDIQANWGDITKIDLKLTCVDQQAQNFQDVQISNLPQCLYESDPNFKAQCDAKIASDSYPLAKMLCKEVDIAGMIQAFGLPNEYYPQNMLAQMPQGQTTTMDLANNTYPTQSVQAMPQVAAQVATPFVQAPPVQQPAYQVPIQEAPVQQVAPPVQSMPQAQVQPIPQPVPQVQPSQVQPQAPADAYSDLDALQNILG